MLQAPRLWYSVPGSASPSALLLPKRVKQLAAMRDAGIHSYEVEYSISEGWRFPGHYDYSGVDAWLAHVVSIDPQARILLRVDLHAPAFWFAVHPEDSVDYALGAPNQPRGRDMGDLATGIRPLRVSLASARWRSATGEALRHLATHLVHSRYAKHVVGVMTACCTYGEWHYWGFFYLPDTGPAMTAHFRQYVRRAYHGSLAAVRRAWGKSLAGWDDITVPKRQRLDRGASTFRSGPCAAWTLDYLRCHHGLVADTLIGFCRTVKQASRGKLATGAFHGYFLNTPWRDEGGHLEFMRVVDSPWVDYLAAPQIYDIHARDIGGTGLDRTLVATMNKRGKTWFSEADTPTHIGRTMKQYWKTRGEIALNADDSIALVRRDAARALAGGHNIWWFDFGRNYQGGEYLHPRIMNDIKRMVKVAENLAHLDTAQVAQVAVAYDDESQYHLSHWRSGRDSVSSGLLDQLLREAQYLGAPADALLWPDVEERHRLVVVANAFWLPEERREQLRRRVCRSGRTVLWMYAPGALGGCHASAPTAEACPNTPETCFPTRRGSMAPGVSSAVGMRVAGMGRPAKPVIRFAGRSPLVEGLAGTAFAYTPAPVWMEKDADLPAPQTLTPAFHVTDRAAEPLAYWEGTQRVAVAAKEERWGTSIFCALPLAPRRFLRNLLAAAGGHVYCTSDDVWLANRGLLAVHTRQGGKREVRLPQPARVTDAMTGRTLAKKTAVFSVQLPKRSTSMWLLEA